MTTKYATFELAPAMRPGDVSADGAYRSHRDFLDFVIDGKPLLRRLSDLDDLDAVSPLAADVGPAVFLSHVRRLLLEAEAPLDGGRYVIYGCPECEGLECGAVTAVIERDDTDVVWRDFAWQTDTTPDLERNGYHGVGPYRFRGEQYGAALRRLLTEGGEKGSAGPGRGRVLLIGQRAAFLARLAAALRGTGIGAEITREVLGTDAGELRAYGAVVFGRTVRAEDRAAVRAAFAAAGSDASFVDTGAPVVPLLVAQIEQALDRGPDEGRRLTLLTANGAVVRVEVAARCRVRLVAHRVDRLGRARAHELFDGPLEPGTYRFPLHRRAARGESFVVARTAGCVRVAPVRH